MTRLISWKSGSAALMAMTITTGAIVPMFAPTPASAQLLRGGQQSGTVSIPAGVRIPVTYDKDKIAVTDSETSPLTLKVARNIVDRSGAVLIPADSEIVGQLRPATINGVKGSRFEAQRLVLPNGNEQSINAVSQTVTRKEKISKGTNTGKVLQDAALGAGAAAAIALVTGDKKIRPLEVLGGAGAGAIASVLLRRKEVEVVSIDPQRDLNVTLRSNLVVSRNYNNSNYNNSY